MKPFRKVILFSAVVGFIGGLGIVAASARENDRNDRHYSAERGQDRQYGDRGRDRHDGHVEDRRRDRRDYGRDRGRDHAKKSHRRNHAYDRSPKYRGGHGQHDRRQHAWHKRGYYKGHKVGRHAYAAKWQNNHYRHHIRHAHERGATGCFSVSRTGFSHGRRALLGGVMCTDRHGFTFVLPQSRHVIHYY